MTQPSATRDEIAVLVRLAGLDPSPEHFAQIVEAWGHVEQMLARIRRARPYAAEPAHVFTPAKFAPGAGEGSR